MFTLQWPLCVWLCMVTHTRSQAESNVNYFQILKYPTELSARYDFNKNSTLKLCYDDYHGDDAAATEAQRTQSPGSDEVVVVVPTKLPSAFLLKILATIAQQIRQSQCGKNKSSTTMSTAIQRSRAQVEPEAGTVASAPAPSPSSSERALRVYYKGQRPAEEEDRPFDILEQLKLDEKRQHQHQEQQHKLKLQSQQQQLTELQHDLWTDTIFANQGKADKKKKKKRKKKNNKKKKQPTKDKDKTKKKKKKRKQQPSLLGQPAHVLFASLTQKPQFQQHAQHVPTKLTALKKPPHRHYNKPIKKIILRKNTIFKKKKKEYLHHLKQVFYPFVKFIAFFTILNPFTLAVFLFSLVSPVVFGFIGFVGLSFLIKPALNLLFGVKRTVSSINRKKLLQKRQRERLRKSRRPITIHKHYYQQTRLPPHRPRQHHQKHHHRQRHSHRHSKHFNPLLPDVKHKLKKALFGPNFVRYEEITNNR